MVIFVYTIWVPTSINNSTFLTLHFNLIRKSRVHMVKADAAIGIPVIVVNPQWFILSYFHQFHGPDAPGKTPTHHIFQERVLARYMVRIDTGTPTSSNCRLSPIIIGVSDIDWQSDNKVNPFCKILFAWLILRCSCSWRRWWPCNRDADDAGPLS